MLATKVILEFWFKILYISSLPPKTDVQSTQKYLLYQYVIRGQKVYQFSMKIFINKHN